MIKCSKSLESTGCLGADHDLADVEYVCRLGERIETEGKEAEKIARRSQVRRLSKMADHGR